MIWVTMLFVPICPRATAAGQPAPAEPRSLNNVVAELLALKRPAAAPQACWPFTNPRAGWVWFQSTAKITRTGAIEFGIEPVRQDSSAQAVQDAPAKDEALWHWVHDANTGATVEAMRFLTAGDFRLTIRKRGSAALESLVIRAVPELIYCKFRYDPLIPPHGPYDWAFLEKSVLPNINCLVGSGVEGHAGFVQQWKQQGKHWLVECGVPGLSGKEPLTTEQAFAYWSQNPGFQARDLDGVIADEFLGYRVGTKYPEWTQAVRRLRADERFRRRYFYPYCTSIYRHKVSAEFLRTVMDCGYPFAWEVYLQEQPDEEQARRHLESKLASEMKRWREALPGCERHMIVCLGYMSLPTTETLNINPQVDYKVWMDLQFQHLATAKEFRDLYGLMEYTSGYADEETVRWAARLYRHYGLEGKTNLLSAELGFAYRLDHLGNPDFAEGTKGWRVDAAEADSVNTNSFTGFGWLEGRYPRTRLGDTFLWTKRSARQPNRITQELKHLKPGKLYSLKLVTADYQELVGGKSDSQKHAVRIHIDGAKLLPEKSFQLPMANNYAHTFGAFKDENKFWMNYHFILFRVEGRSATLTLSDWAEDGKPGGPVGQELAWNFVEMQPYFEMR